MGIEHSAAIVAAIASKSSRESVKKVPSSKEMIDKMFAFEAAIGQLPGAKFGDEAGPLKHTFADGLYIRQYTGLKDTIAVSKLHKTNHPYFVLRGDVSVLTDDGLVRIKAPYWGITKAGTKRILYFHENTTWITVHATKETDLKKIEEQTIANTYDELPENVKENLEIESKTTIEIESDIERK